MSDQQQGTRNARIVFTEEQLIEVEWSLRLRLDSWDDDDPGARRATEGAYRKVLAALDRRTRGGSL